MTSRYLFSPAGQQAIADILRTQPLIAFDFDGTLAPIVSVPDQARAGIGVARAMARLCELAPVAVVTGRSIADVRDRLGFTPRHIVGNHGAEGLPGDAVKHDAAAVEAWRAGLAAQRQRLDANGIDIEDKQQSLTLHYRLARDRDAALRVIEEVVAGLVPSPRLIGGKCVVNLLPEGAADKYVAIRSLLQLEGRHAAIFVGDDVTDDIVFEQAPPNWLTVRVEHKEAQHARFFLNAQSEVATLIQTLIAGLGV